MNIYEYGDKSMKVCVLAFSYPSLTETFVRKHVEGLKATVIAEQLYMGSPNSTNGGSHHISLERPFITNALSPIGRFTQFVIRHVFRKGNYVIPQKTKTVLKRQLIALNPDIVLAEFGHLAVTVLQVLRELRIPLVVHFHGMDLSVCWKQTGYRRQLSDLCDYASGLIVVNQRVQAVRLMQCGCPVEKIHCIPCGANIASIKPLGHVINRHVRFISVSRLTEKKGPVYTLKAFRECNRHLSDTSLTMIGDGPMMGKCLKYIKDYDLIDRVNMLGPLPHEDVLAQMQNASIFLLHSIVSRNGDEEGWGVAIAEAQGAGLPIVSTRSGGIPENVLDGKSGFLVKERGWREMADRMQELAENPELRKTMGTVGRNHILHNGDADMQLVKLRKVLESVIASK